MTMLSLASGGSQCSRLIFGLPAFAGAAAACFSAGLVAAAGLGAAGAVVAAGAVGGAGAAGGLAVGLGAWVGWGGAGVWVGGAAGPQADRIGSAAAAPSPSTVPRRNDRRDHASARVWRDIGNSFF